MKGIIPILCIVVAGALFYLYIDPTYAEIKELRVQEGVLDQALSRALELQQTRDQLLSRYNTFAPADLAKAEKMLPDHVDNVRLVLDMDSMASKYGMRVRNVSVQDPHKPTTNQPQPQQAVGPNEAQFESMVISFTVSGQYDTFMQFLNDLEHSLRLVDLESLSFGAPDNGVYDFTVSLRTYWLKP